MTFTVSPETAGCDSSGGGTIGQNTGTPGPAGCEATPPLGNPAPPVTVTCGGHDASRPVQVCVYGTVLGGADPAACKTCDTVTYLANCDIATPGADPLTPGNIGAGRNQISCPNDFTVTCTAAGQVIDLNAIGCTSTNQIAPYPGPLFFYSSSANDCNYYYANETNVLPTTITCTQEMVDGTGCSYQISGMPSTGCLNKVGPSITHIKIGGATTTTYTDADTTAGCAATVIPADPPLGWQCIQ